MLNWLREEFLQILPVWIFFFLAFGLVSLIRTTTIGEYNIQPLEPPDYLLGSLIMAKVVVLVDAFMKNRRGSGRPLIYGTLLNTGLYFAAALILHHVEQTVSLVRHHHVGFAEASHDALLATEKPNFLAIMLFILVLTFAFCMVRELIRCIGEDRFLEVFFGRRPRTGGGDIRRAPEVLYGELGSGGELVSPSEFPHQLQFIQQKTGQQEILPDALLTCAGQLVPVNGIQQETANGRSTFFQAVDENSAHSITHLQRNAAGCSSDDRSRFPHGFGDNQPKSFTKRFLNDHLRQSLERVHLDIADADHIGEYVNSGISPRTFPDFIINLPALRIVRRH